MTINPAAPSRVRSSVPVPFPAGAELRSLSLRSRSEKAVYFRGDTVILPGMTALAGVLEEAHATEGRALTE